MRFVGGHDNGMRRPKLYSVGVDSWVRWRRTDFPQSLEPRCGVLTASSGTCWLAVLVHHNRYINLYTKLESSVAQWRF